MTAGATGPVLSVVVAARMAEADPLPALRALSAEGFDDVEILLISDVERPEASLPSGVQLLHLPGALVPELWAVGLRHARGAAVALTTSTLRATPGWLARARELAGRADGPAVIGGGFQGSAAPGWVEAAVLYCRYSAFLAPLTSGPADAVAGDNAVYRLDVLRRYEQVWRDGFWEPFVHSRMIADGFTMSHDATLVLEQAPGLRLGGFLQQRYWHGRVHGHRRSTRGPLLTRLAACSAPAVPLLMTARAMRASWGHPEHRWPTLRSLPLLLLLYSAWAAGELRGRLDAARSRL